MPLLLEAGAFAVVVLATAFLFALGVASLLAPTQASRLLLGFASTRGLHFTELAFRSIAGAAFVLYAPQMYWSEIFRLAGWVLLVTTALLAVIPWRWHQRFAQRTVPPVTRYIALIGLASLALAGAIGWAIVRGDV
jgi:hypothetical protein